MNPALVTLAVSNVGFVLLLWVARRLPGPRARSRGREAVLWVSAVLQFAFALGGVSLLPNDGTWRGWIDDGACFFSAGWMCLFAALERRARNRPPDTRPRGLLARIFFGKRESPAPVEPWALDTPLFHWAKDDPWTIRDSFESLLIMGGTGSGKTSGSGHLARKQFLLNGYGGMVMCCKEDRDDWVKLAAETGRTKDLFIWGVGRGLHFNFLDWQVSRPGRGAGFSETVVQTFSQVMEVANRGSGAGDGREDASYFKHAMNALLRSTVDLLILAGLFRSL